MYKFWVACRNAQDIFIIYKYHSYFQPQKVDQLNKLNMFCMIRLKLVWSITITNHINYNWMYSLAVRGDLILNILNMIEQRGNYLVLVSLFWRPLHNYTCVYTATSYTRIIQHPGFVQSESFKNVTF